MKRKSLFSSIRILFLLSISIAFILTALVFSYIYNQLLIDNNLTNITNTLTSISTNMELYISELNSIANIPYYNKNVFDSMVEINDNNNTYDDLSINEMPAGRDYRVAFLKYIYDSSQAIDSVTFYPMKNESNTAFILSRNTSKTDIQTQPSYKQSDWYLELMVDNKKSSFFPEYDADGKLSAFSYVKSIQDVDTKEIIGFIKVSSSSNSYIDLLGKMDVGEYSSLCFVTDDNQILYNHTASAKLMEITLLDDIYSQIPGGYQVLSSTITDTKLTLIHIASYREYRNSQLITYCMVFLIVAVSCTFSFIIYQHKAKKITQTISTIKDSLNQVANGNFKLLDIRPPETELNEIVTSTNQMIMRLKEFITKEYKANLMQQEAEYRALQAQINPHFLYNTLNGFIALNRMGDRQLLETSIINLTHLFQYTCNASTTVYLDDETKFVKQYLNLQTLKYDGRLSFTIDIDTRIEKTKIPKLLLQPIIENSIIHGLEPTDRPILIQLLGTSIITSFGTYIFIMIADNGMGFLPSSLDKKERIGLENIRKRLKYNNPNNLFHIESTRNIGTRCIILLKT